MHAAALSLPGAALAVLLAGCATAPLSTDLADSPAVMVNIPPAGDARWTMNIRQAPTNIAVQLTLNIDGTPVGTGTWYPGPADIKGTYAGHPVQALCQVTGAASTKPGGIRAVATGSCVVFVEGTQVATLLF